ncbi:transcription initiation factor TFIID subunit 8 [Magnolia sinica]|uniref:transcription initiation factor TFIID subunit 8 n=1 Tax=Magnolia sinica TaxID=86752 RepID=UPI00265AFE9F|nr:transcription initiation factor TFIID subunit 8 [Magnolia sinica]XP_058096452.1 transcription initiation factor TFIID subunit 8 [Magnolia sinica]XP_058096454.1 transcription initiation factor TFIID subunit 8 [Magnolia sinica]XP_058096455.1 transcription initiation factor TFIID subunit 8 [Magnolia sinica]XP_058096456.1 transcription initiation factor TFIID subunit 8 [Magnolia sinica]
MSDGGGESGRDIDNSGITHNNSYNNSNESGTKSREAPSGSDDFGRAVTRIAVAQVCEVAGFQSFQQSALDALSDIAVRYLRDLGKTARFYANSSGRTECNVFDVIQGLEDLCLLQGFSGASDVNRCLAGSGTVREIMQYVSLSEEIPFVRPLPRFPVIKARKPTPSFAQVGEVPPGKHIPDWLPAFPDPHTYVRTPVWNERAKDPSTDKMEQARQQARQRRKAERSLLSLQQRLACNGTAGPSWADAGDAGKEKGALDANPFLAPPLQFGEKDVSVVNIPARLSNEAAVENQVSVLETFAPAIEAAKSGFSDSGEGERKVLPNKRPAVRFGFGIDKKSVSVPLGMGAKNMGVERSTYWFGRDDEKDDKKRRAEQILKEAMESPQELAQL